MNKVLSMIEVNSSSEAFHLLKSKFNPFSEEVWVISLDTQLHLISLDMVFRGTANACLIHPRDIFRTLILNNACSFILAHNHPSKSVLPSPEDLTITRKIQQLSKVFEIKMNDHIIFTDQIYFSLADSGLFKIKPKK